jgi:hypothetical protein
VRSLHVARKPCGLGVKSLSSNIGGEKCDDNTPNPYYDSTYGDIANLIWFSTEPRFEYFAFFRFLPSVRTYYRAREAIEKLGDLKRIGTIKLSVLTSRDAGFRELVLILLKCGLLSGNIDELRLEKEGRVVINMPIGGFQSLIAKREGNDEVIIDTKRSDQQPMYILRTKADVFVREVITRYILYLAITVFISTIICITICG